MPATTRRLLPYPAGGDSPAGFTQVQSLAQAIDNYGIDLFGTEANLPVIGVGAGQMSAEDDGTFYYATDTRETWRYVHGTGWVKMLQRGRVSAIDAEEARTNVAFGFLGTNDKVTLTTSKPNSLVLVTFRALVKESVSGAARVGLFFGATQARNMTFSGASALVFQLDGVNARNGAGAAVANTYRSVHVSPTGDMAIEDVTLTGDQAFTVGAFNGLPALLFEVPTAGTYDIGIQYAATSGTVTAKSRRLWVVPFDMP